MCPGGMDPGPPVVSRNAVPAGRRTWRRPSLPKPGRSVRFHAPGRSENLRHDHTSHQALTVQLFQQARSPGARGLAPLSISSRGFRLRLGFSHIRLRLAAFGPGRLPPGRPGSRGHPGGGCPGRVTLPGSSPQLLGGPAGDPAYQHPDEDCEQYEEKIHEIILLRAQRGSSCSSTGRSERSSSSEGAILEMEFLMSVSACTFLSE